MQALLYNAITGEERITVLMEVKDIIRNRRLEMGLTMKELAEKVGVSEGTVSRWESGNISNMKRDKVALLSKILGVPLEVLMGWETDADRFWNFAQAYNESRFGDSISKASIATYPLLGEVACGEPIIANNEYETYSDGNDIKADAVVKAKGDSMTGARIFEGDIIFIRYQDTVENGEIAAVLVESDGTHDWEIVLKRFYRYGDDLVVLRSENSAYKDMEFHGADIKRLRVIGKAVAFQSLIQ
jgi:repressor LexA